MSGLDGLAANRRMLLRILAAEATLQPEAGTPRSRGAPHPPAHGAGPGGRRGLPLQKKQCPERRDPALHSVSGGHRVGAEPESPRCRGSIPYIIRDTRL